MSLRMNPDRMLLSRMVMAAVILFSVNLSSPSASAQIESKCYLERFVQPKGVSRKVDFLLVVDTSGSMNDEHGAIVREMDAFARALNPCTDMRIAVMLAHGSKSAYSGRLYRAHHEPLVLRLGELRWNKLRNALRLKLTNMPSDRSTDGGEVGLVSLNRSLDSDRLQEAKASGFFRDDAALVVVFVSDENDICAIYPKGIVPVRDPEGLEAPAKARECQRRLSDGTIDVITSDSVVARLKVVKKEMPIVVGGVVYSKLATLVRHGENELGYGYLEAIAAGGGQAIDLGERDYGRGLYQLGIITQQKIDVQHDFKLSQSNVQASSVRVDIDGSPAVFSFDTKSETVHVAQAGFYESRVEIRYCTEAPAPTPTPTPIDNCGSRGCNGTGI